jgi:PKD repeat protein
MQKLTLSLLTIISVLGVSMLISSFTQKERIQTRENTPGTVTFSVTTQSQGGSYAPKHVLAIWVEHNGEFVKTRKAMANQRKQYLYTWKAASNYNVTDAITGPTLSSHTSHTIEWDCTDLDGNVVEDGEYVMWIEFTEKHAQGPLFNVAFEKGPDGFDITPADESYFKNMQLTWEPEVVLVADFTADIEETCLEETVTFTDNSTGATTWDWDFGENATPATANTQGPHEVTYSSPGSKTVSLTIDQGITQTKTGYITVYPDATAGFTWSQEDLTITFTNTSQNATAFSWNFGDGNFSTEMNPVHTYEDYGQYNVSLIAIPALCEEDMYAEEIAVNIIGIDSREPQAKVNVYPNPGNGIFNISVADDWNNCKISLFDISGKLILEQNHSQVSNGSTLTFGNNQITPGIYFLNMQHDHGKLIEKVLVK